MLPNEITLSLPNASIKLQPSFPIDNRFDITIILNPTTSFKLRKAYLKCWSKYFQRELKPALQTFTIPFQFNSVQFTSVMSTFYGHSAKVHVRELLPYYQITSFLEIQEVLTHIRDHIMAFHQSFDHFGLLQTGLKWRDEEMKEFVLSTIRNGNFSEVVQRREEVMQLPLDVFRALMECISSNVNSNTMISWKTLNGIIKDYTATKGQQLYGELREEYIIESKLTAQEYSAIFAGTDSKLPPISKKPGNKLQLSQLIQNKSVFFGSQISNDFNRIMEKYNKNSQKYSKIQEKLNKLEQKSQSIDDLFGKTSVHITQLQNQFKRLNLNPVVLKLDQSESSPFPQHLTSDTPAKVPQLSNLNRQSYGMESLISSQEPLTFSVKAESVREDQIGELEKILGFDNISRGFLKLLFRADAKKTKQEFLAAIEGKQDLVFLIYIFQDSKNIGVYTSTKINTKATFNHDSQAFIFSLNNGMRFKTKDPSKSIIFDDNHLISFSDDIQLRNNILEEMSVCKWPTSYSAGKEGANGAEWLVGNEMFHVSEFEVYEILRIQIEMEIDL